MNPLPGNTTRLKELNTECVREALTYASEATKQSLARATGLSTATCGNILNDMLAAGEVVELAPAASNGGRPARTFAYNFRYVMLALLHIGKEAGIRTLTSDIVDAAGGKVEHQAEILPLITVEVLECEIERILKRYPAVKAVAISYPGVVRDGAIDTLGDLEELFECELKTRLEQKFPIRVALENDMNLAALGYYCRRGALEESGLCYLSFFRDILPGCGSVINGKLIRGRDGFAGEVTFLPLGYSMEQQLEQLRTPEGRSRLVAQTVITVIALLNPATVVLCGAMFEDPELRRQIHTRCRTAILARYLPEVVFRDDWMEDVQSGLLERARELLRCPVQLILR